MTREEAISLIKSAQLMLINPTTNEPVSDLYEALEMAIQALSQEPCSVLEQIQADIYEHFMTIDGGVHDKSALKCMEIIDKYKASEEISERNMKMWEEIFKAESEDKK